VTAIFEDVFRQMLVDCDVVGTRVFLMRAPQVPAEQQRTPYLVYFHVGPSPLHSITKPLAVLDREYQVSVFDSSQSRAIGIADSLRAKLDGVRGDYLGIRFGAILYRSQTSAFESGPEIFQVVVNFQILFQFLDGFQALNQNQRKPSAPQRSNRI
jgi:hypothetical protein